MTQIRRCALVSLAVIGVLLTSLAVDQQPAQATTVTPAYFSTSGPLTTGGRVYGTFTGPQTADGGTGGHICASGNWTTEAQLWANCSAISHFMGNQTVAFLAAGDVGKYLYFDYDPTPGTGQTNHYLSGPLGPITDGGTTGSEYFKIANGILVDGQKIMGQYRGPGDPNVRLQSYICATSSAPRAYDFGANCVTRVQTEWNVAQITTADHGKYLYFVYDDGAGTHYSSNGYGPITNGETNGSGYFSQTGALRTGERFYGTYNGPATNDPGTSGYLCASGSWVRSLDVRANCQLVGGFVGYQFFRLIAAGDQGKYLYLTHSDGLGTEHTSVPYGPITDGGTTGSEYFKIANGILVDGQKIMGQYHGPGDPNVRLQSYICALSSAPRAYDFAANCITRVQTEWNVAQITTADHGKYLFFVYDDGAGTHYSSNGYGPITNGETNGSGYFSTTGTLAEGQRVTGTYSGPHTTEIGGTTGYLCAVSTWIKNVDVGTNCESRSGFQGDSSYVVLGSADIGKYVYFTHSDGLGTVYVSAPYGPVAKIVPVHSGNVTITGPVVQGGQLTADPGTWGPAGVVVSGQWRHCDNAGDNCTNIVGATDTSYTISFAPGDGTLRYRSTGVFNGTTTPLDSAPTAVIASPRPSLVTAPALGGTAIDGAILTVTPGTYTSALPFTRSYLWARCAGLTCVNITDVTGTSYHLSAADVGTTIKVTETATTSLDSSAASVSTPEPVVGIPASWATPASLTGGSVVSETVTYTPGTVAGTAPITATYRWELCDAADVCTALEGTDTNTRTVTLSDTMVGHHVRVTATATNAWGTAGEVSTGPAVLAPVAPELVTAATITGTPTIGETLTASTGTWSARPTPTLRYTWTSCTWDNSSCVIVATDATYQVVAGDAGRHLTATVTATNVAGTASSAPTVDIAGLAPSLVTSPAVRGELLPGGLLNVSNGAWAGTHLDTSVWSYTWFRCTTADTGTCTPTADTADTHTVGWDPTRPFLAARVHIETRWGHAETWTDFAPVTLTGPSIPETVSVGSPISVDNGRFIAAGPDQSFTYQWHRCTTPTSCVDVGSDSPTYTPTDDDAGRNLTVDVVGTVNGVTVAQATNPSDPVNGRPAAVTTPTLTVDGATHPGATITVHYTATGTAPVAAHVTWYRCGSACTPITGASGDTYTVTADDVGSRIGSQVTASNAWATATSEVVSTSTVAWTATVMISAPQLTGVPAATGDTVTVTDGSWAVDGPHAFSYQWIACDADGRSCAPIPGATTASYTTTDDDYDRLLGATVTVSAPVGTSSFDTARTVIAGHAPRANSAASITGAVRDGELLTASPGQWSGVPNAVTFTYAWARCQAAGCTTMSTASTYRLTAADVGATMQLTVTAHNAAGATAASATTAPVAAAPPANVTRPAVSGSPIDGSTLTATTGSWSGTGPLTYTYTWSRCAGPTCVVIDGASGPTYRLKPADVGDRVVVAVTARNVAGAASASSVETPAVSPLTPTGPNPTIAGTARVGETLAATAGTWDGTPPLTYTWQWLRCLDDRCVAISGADAASYELSAADVNATIMVRVTVTGPGGTTSRDASRTETIVRAPGVTLEQPITSDGQTITVTGHDFKADSDVQVFLHSDPVLLGVAHTDANGSFTATFAVPPGTTAGAHHVVLDGFDAAGRPVTVELAVTIAAPAPADSAGRSTATRPSPAPLPATGFAGGLLPAGAVALLVAGLGLTGVGRRTRRCR